MADEQTQTPEVETKARNLGWVPKEEFRGDESRWVDAEEFVTRGEQMMPLLRKNNERLQNDLSTLSGKFEETNKLLQASQEAIAELKKFHTEDTARQVEKARKELRKQLIEARKEDDVELQVEIEEQLDEIRQVQATPPPKPTPAPTAAPVAGAPQVDPEFVAWQRDNDWWLKDRRRTALTVAEAEELRADPKNAGLKGRAFYEEAAKRADAVLNPRSTTSKVETGTPSTSGGGGSKKRSYADLPADAKEVCSQQASKLVGAGRAFKTLPEWQAHYVEQYFLGE